MGCGASSVTVTHLAGPAAVHSSRTRTFCAPAISTQWCTDRQQSCRLHTHSPGASSHVIADTATMILPFTQCRIPPVCSIIQMCPHDVHPVTQACAPSHNTHCEPSQPGAPLAATAAGPDAEAGALVVHAAPLAQPLDGRAARPGAVHPFASPDQILCTSRAIHLLIVILLYFWYMILSTLCGCGRTEHSKHRTVCGCDPGDIVTLPRVPAGR